MNDPINMDKAERIAFADTKHLNRPRWSELSVFYLHEPTAEGKRWVALSVGMSSRAGETAITDKLVAYALDGALALFDDSPIGKIVKAEARDWATHHQADGDEVAGHPAATRFDGDTDKDALDWLFGDTVKSGAARAKALGLNESTLRQQVGGAGVRVALRSVLPFIDRAAFRAALASDANG